MGAEEGGEVVMEVDQDWEDEEGTPVEAGVLRFGSGRGA